MKAKTFENLIRNVVREEILQGAILTRIASSHIRVGTFQYLIATDNHKNLKTLVDYTIDRHYQNIKKSNTPVLDLLKIVIKKQADNLEEAIDLFAKMKQLPRNEFLKLFSVTENK